MDRKRSPVVIAVFYANLAALVAGSLTALAFVPSWTEAIHALAYSFVCANCVAVAGGLILPRLVHAAAARRYPIPAFIAIGSIAVAAVGCLLAQTVLTVLRVAQPSEFWPDFFSIVKVAALLAVVFAMGSFFYGSMKEQLRLVTLKLHEKEVAEERARKLAAEAKLASLESRLHPHFLFNALNSVAALIPLDPTRAEEMLTRLSRLLRKAPNNTQSALIPLQDEIETAEEYLAIECMRLGRRLATRIEIPDDVLSTPVPAFSVQALAENAVKHGISQLRDRGEIAIMAERVNGCLHIRVSDNGAGFDVGEIVAGHGLDTLVGRLDVIFGPAARLNILRENAKCVVELVIPVQ